MITLVYKYIQVEISRKINKVIKLREKKIKLSAEGKGVCKGLARLEDMTAFFTGL